MLHLGLYISHIIVLSPFLKIRSVELPLIRSDKFSLFVGLKKECLKDSLLPVYSRLPNVVVGIKMAAMYS